MALKQVLTALSLAIPSGFVAFGAAPTAARAQQPQPDPKEILVKYRQNIRAEAFAGLTHAHMAGEYLLPAQKIRGEVDAWMARPDRQLVVVRISRVGEFRTGYSGAVGWTMTPADGAKLLKGADLQTLVDEGNFDANLLPESLVKMVKMGDRAKLGGHDCFKMLVLWNSGRESTACFATSTGDLVAINRTSLNAASGLETLTLFDDYKVFGPVRLPAKQTTRTGSNESVIQWQQISFDAFPDSVFEPPAEVSALYSSSKTATQNSPAQRPATLESQIKAELLNKTFQTKIVLGNVLTTDATAKRVAQNLLVDTNLHPGGRILYYLRVSAVSAPPGNVSVTCARNQQYLWTGAVFDGRLCQVKAGVSARVWSITVNDDRLEVWLLTVPEEAYAKIKFIFGKGWQKTMNLDAVMEGVSAGLVIESIERVRSIAREYTDLQQQLRASSPPPSSDPADRRLDHARRVRDTLNALVKNRTEHEKLGKGSAAQETKGYIERVREIDAEIPRLEAEHRKDQLDRIRISLSSAESEAVGIRTRLGIEPPKTLGELKAMEEFLSKWDANLRHRDELEKALRMLGEQLTPAAVAARDRDREEIRKRRADLAALEAKLQMADRNVAYARMKSEENRLKAAYVAAFDTPRQRDAATQFRSHLQAMIANREAGVRLGEPGASAEIQRLRNQLAGIR